jgi:hypothetical protein
VSGESPPQPSATAHTSPRRIRRRRIIEASHLAKVHDKRGRSDLSPSRGRSRLSPEPPPLGEQPQLAGRERA